MGVKAIKKVVTENKKVKKVPKQKKSAPVKTKKVLPLADYDDTTENNEVEPTIGTPEQVTLSIEDLVGSDNLTTKCEISKEQFDRAVSAAFKAFEFSKTKKDSSGVLFDQEAEPVILTVSSIKIIDGEATPISVTLPHPYVSKDNDICLITKDLTKGWKENHEPTIHHYQELLAKKNVDFVNEVVPLRQLRVEYKPFEAKSKLAKIYDVVLVDKRVIKFVPRYLGKFFYQSGKLPIPVDVEATNLSSELKRGLSTSVMSMVNLGTCSEIRIGSSNQSETEISSNLAATYEALVKNYPGTFANVRSLYIRFGTEKWIIPVYISCASRQSVPMPSMRAKAEPIVDELSTLTPGLKVEVHPGGIVKVVKDLDYVKTAMDGVKDKPTPKNKNKKRKKDKTVNKVDIKKAASVDSEASDIDEDEDAVEDDEPVVKKVKKAKAEADSSEDEGDALEDEYMKELDLLEEEEETVQNVQSEASSVKRPKKTKKVLVKKRLPKKVVKSKV